MTFTLTKNTTNALKVLAAITVLLHHYSQRVCAGGVSDSIFYKLFSFQGGFLGVAIFFFLSGYGLMESEQKSHLNLYAFFKRRFLKVYLPVITVTVLWYSACCILEQPAKFQSISAVMGGGKWLIFSDILINFGDGVLWFVKILILLYAMFYLFSLIFKTKRVYGMIFLCLATIFISWIADNYIGNFAPISVPIFSLGIIVSLTKGEKAFGMVACLCIMLLILSNWLFYSKGMAIHSTINALAIAALILLLSIKRIDIKIPAILGLISFDLYLVHNKVLMVMVERDVFPSLWLYLLITAAVTSLFFLFRTKLLKI